MLSAALLTKGMVIDELTESGQVGRTETQKNVFFPKAEYPFTYTGYGYEFHYEPGYDNLRNFVEENPNAKVIFEWDGERYEFVPENNSANTISFGNFAMLIPAFAGTADDTGEPFFVTLTTTENYIRVATQDTSATHTCSIYNVTETIHPIDPKYLPGVCLPMVELSTALTMETAITPTAEESAKLDEVAAKCMPFVLKIPANPNATGYLLGLVSCVLSQVDGKSALYGSFSVPVLGTISIYHTTSNGWNIQYGEIEF